MSHSQEYLEYVLEQLAGVGRVTSRRMFGGVGLYCDDVFFALISGDALYFKVDDSNRADYVARGARQFIPFPDRPQRDKANAGMGYYELPADALEDADECVVWARRSVAVALAAARRLKPAARRKN
jgi:DNA transformation protein and related proteins